MARLGLPDAIVSNDVYPITRLRLFKIAARLTLSVRRIHIELCSAYPLKALFALIHQRLGALHAPA
jgi:hypothetical protein